MILRRVRPLNLTQRLETHTHLQVSPRLNLTVLRTSEAGELRVERVLPGSTGERVLRREEYVRQFLDRGRRQDAGAPSPAAEGSAAGALVSPPQRPIPSVLLRSQPVAAKETSASTPTVSAKPWPPPAPPQAPSVDVNRLTEQVIHQIDRRLQSFKERTGRR
jgi:hypothetical protein